VGNDFALYAQATDPDSHEVHFEWKNAAGTVVATSQSFYPGQLNPGTYEFTVTAFDGRGGSASDSTTLTVTAYKEINIYAAALAWPVAGAWRVVDDATAAGGQRLEHPDAGAAKVTAPAADPVNYFEVSFLADPTQTYKLWVRERAERNAWSNDSVFVQFSGAADISGQPAWQIGSTDALAINLEECSGCGLSGWGWEDDGWGAVNRNGTLMRFPGGGWQTIRVQTREDGVSIDQIVLSSDKYLTMRPGAAKNDTTILPPTVNEGD
jgi:hypothetical protein